CVIGECDVRVFDGDNITVVIDGESMNSFAPLTWSYIICYSEGVSSSDKVLCYLTVSPRYASYCSTERRCCSVTFKPFESKVSDGVSSTIDLSDGDGSAWSGSTNAVYVIDNG